MVLYSEYLLSSQHVGNPSCSPTGVFWWSLLLYQLITVNQPDSSGTNQYLPPDMIQQKSHSITFWVFRQETVNLNLIKPLFQLSSYKKYEKYKNTLWNQIQFNCMASYKMERSLRVKRNSTVTTINCGVQSLFGSWFIQKWLHKLIMVITWLWYC